MRHKFGFTFLSILLLYTYSSVVFAQFQPVGVYKDVIRYSNTDLQGSSRIQGMGGVGMSLGGDISSASLNPAGLGFSRKSEYHISASVYSNSADISGSGFSGTGGETQFNIPQLGIVFSRAKSGTQKWKGFSFAISYNRLNDFHTQNSYQGNASTQTTILEDMSADLYGSSIAFLEEEDYFGATRLGSMGYIAGFFRPQFARAKTNESDDAFNRKNQSFYTIIDSNPSTTEGEVMTFGRQQEFNFAIGGNYDDKLYIGAKLGVTTLTYEKDQSYTELRDGKDMISLKVEEFIRSSGIGVNAKFGVIYAPHDYWRIGGTVTTPTAYNVDDEQRSALSATYDELVFNEAEWYQSIYGEIPEDYNADTQDRVLDKTKNVDGALLTSNFRFTTPWKAGLSVTRFLGKRGLVSADIEYIAYQTAKLSGFDDIYVYSDGYQESFPLDITPDNQILENENRGVFNLNIGTEFRFKRLYLRAGYAFKPDPRKKELQTVNLFNFEWFDDPSQPIAYQQSINRDKQYFTFGLGYRSRKFYADFALTYGMTNSPYSFYQLDVLSLDNFIDSGDANYATQKSYLGGNEEILIHPVKTVDENMIRTMISIGKYF